jgi:RHS repeat-associated protein
MTDSSGVVQRRYDFLPFGEEIPQGINGRSAPYETSLQLTTPDATDTKFTGKVRDSESNLDFFKARFFSGPQARFSSADPGNAGASGSQPQSWNGYGYVSNNPLAFVDPAGLAQNSVIVDGMQVDRPYGMFGKLGANAMVPCPNNICTGYDESGHYYQFGSAAGAGGSYYTRYTSVTTVINGQVHITLKAYTVKADNPALRDYSQHEFFSGEPNPYVKVATDVTALAAAIAGKAGNKLGIATSIISLATDRSPKNIVTNVLPLFFPDTGLPLAIYGVAEDASGFVANQVLIPVFTPDALQSDMIDDGNGHLVQSPNSINFVNALGTN